MRSLQMGTSTMAVTSRGSPMVKVSTVGPMGRYTTENGNSGSKTVTGSGEARAAIPILASGSTVKHKGTACTLGKTKTNSRASGSRTSDMVTAVISSKTGTNMWASM